MRESELTKTWQIICNKQQFYAYIIMTRNEESCSFSIIILDDVMASIDDPLMHSFSFSSP